MPGSRTQTSPLMGRGYGGAVGGRERHSAVGGHGCDRRLWLTGDSQAASSSALAGCGAGGSAKFVSGASEDLASLGNQHKSCPSPSRGRGPCFRSPVRC